MPFLQVLKCKNGHNDIALRYYSDRKQTHIRLCPSDRDADALLLVATKFFGYNQVPKGIAVHNDKTNTLEDI